MKKNLFVFVTLCVSLLFFGCSRDAKLTKYVPDDVDFVAFLDATTLKTETPKQGAEKQLRNLLKEIKLSDDILNCRLLAFGHFSDEWGGLLVQSQKGEVEKLFEKVPQMEPKDICKKLEDGEVKGKKCYKGKLDEDTKFSIVLINKNLALVAIGKTDFDFFKAKNTTSLLKNVKLKNNDFYAALSGKFMKEKEFEKQMDKMGVPTLKDMEILSFSSEKNDKLATISGKAVFKGEKNPISLEFSCPVSLLKKLAVDLEKTYGTSDDEDEDEEDAKSDSKKSSKSADKDEE